MAIPAEVRTKFYGLRLLALLLFVFPAWVLISRPPDFGIRLPAFLTMIVSFWIVRRSNVAVWRARGHVVPALSFTKFGVPLVACAIIGWFLYLAAFGGDNQIRAFVLVLAGLMLVLVFAKGIFRPV